MKTTKLENGMIVTASRILGTRLVIFEALEPTTLMGNHSSVMWIDDQYYGELPTRRLPAHLAALPAMTDERIEAVSAWHKEQAAQAHALILSVYPDLAQAGTFRANGSVEQYFDTIEQAEAASKA